MGVSQGQKEEVQWVSVQQLARFQFLNGSSGVHFCINLYIFCFMTTCSAGLNLQPANKAQVLNLFFQREEERGSHSQSCAASPPVRCSSSLSLYLACSPNNEHHFECIDCDYYHHLGPHHNNKFLHSVIPSREVVMLLNFLYSMTAQVFSNQSKLMGVPVRTNSQAFKGYGDRQYLAVYVKAKGTAGELMGTLQNQPAPGSGSGGWTWPRNPTTWNLNAMANYISQSEPRATSIP